MKPHSLHRFQLQPQHECQFVQLSVSGLQNQTWVATLVPPIPPLSVCCAHANCRENYLVR